MMGSRALLSYKLSFNPEALCGHVSPHSGLVQLGASHFQAALISSFAGGLIFGTNASLINISDEQRLVQLINNECAFVVNGLV